MKIELLLHNTSFHFHNDSLFFCPFVVAVVFKIHLKFYLEI